MSRRIGCCRAFTGRRAPVDLFCRKPFPELIHQILDLYRLGYEIIHAGFLKQLAGFLKSIGRQSYYHEILFSGYPVSYGPGGIYTVHDRHHVIHEHDIIVVCFNFLNSVLSAERGIDLYLHGSKEAFHDRDIDRIIIDNQNARVRRCIIDGISVLGRR